MYNYNKKRKKVKNFFPFFEQLQINAKEILQSKISFYEHLQFYRHSYF